MKVSCLDLKINNIVYNVASGSKEVCKIKAITRLGVQYDSETRQGNCSMDNLESIQLTEEWLTKLGFENSYESKFRKCFDIKTNSGYLTYNLSKHEKENSRVNLKGTALEFDFLNYVHQLQNLYFSLTGSELTTKI